MTNSTNCTKHTRIQTNTQVDKRAHEQSETHKHADTRYIIV